MSFFLDMAYINGWSIIVLALLGIGWSWYDMFKKPPRE